MQFNDYIDSLLEQYDESYSHRIRKKYKNPALALGQAEQGEKVGKDGKSIPKHEEDKVSDKDYKAPTSEEEEGKEKGLDGKACWDGYKLQGTKKKGGKTVDNCVKIEDAEDIPAEMVDEFHLALDELIHKYLGHSSDETAEEDAEGSVEYSDVFEDVVFNYDDLMEYTDITPEERFKQAVEQSLEEINRITEREVEDFLDYYNGEDDTYIMSALVKSLKAGNDFKTAKERMKEALNQVPFEDIVKRTSWDYDEDAEGKIDKDRMKCNSPRRTSGGSKKFVVKACKDGKEKIVRFGDPNMKIKKSNPKRRKSFRARHKCDQKKDKFSAGYWSCKKW